MFKNKYLYLLLVSIIILSSILLFLVLKNKDSKIYSWWSTPLKKEEIESIKKSIIENTNSTSKDLDINNF